MDPSKPNRNHSYPEHIIKEEATQQDATVYDFVQLQELNTVDGESQSEYVIGDPMLFCW